MDAMYKSRDEAFMRSLHARIEGLAISLESAISSWQYFKRQILLNDLYKYSCTVLSYKPMFIPCVNTNPDVLFITRTECDLELSMYNTIRQSMRIITTNIHRTSITKTLNIGEPHEINTVLNILASEIAILNPKAVFLFYGAAARALSAKVNTNLFIVSELIDTESCHAEINEQLLQLVAYLKSLI